MLAKAGRLLGLNRLKLFEGTLISINSNFIKPHVLSGAGSE